MSADPTAKKGDIVYTPDWVALDMVDHFAPHGRVLDPCRGKGAFTQFLPGADWCEITDGRDFFEWQEPVDWVIGNPPYSMTRPWFRHSYEVATHLVYLVPLRNVFSGFGFVREIHDFGGIREIRTYGTGGKLGFPMGNAVGAFHIERDYSGSTVFSFPAPTAGTEPLTLDVTDPACTGLTAFWCPVHGYCTCPSYDDDPPALDDPNCPLHSFTSTHGSENPDD